ncbi:MAG: winged helix-turn-helix transcriptional regulator [Calditrichaeota bacterium]|nr:winged helix-turn-helix transcriptional regulator [Calditrichota bacterium]
MKKSATVFKALSDTNRLRIMKMLEVRDLCVCEITEILQLAPSTVSKHLSILRNAELVLDKKEGKWVIYGLNYAVNDNLKKVILDVIRKDIINETVLQDNLKVGSTDRNTICNVNARKNK